MKKYLVVATVLVALVALFSFSASAADVALDANVAYTADAAGVSVDTIAVNLSGAVAPEAGYYTVLAYTGNEDPAQGEILYAAQEVNAITGFNVAADKLNGALYVKFGGTGLNATQDDAEFVFALVALNGEGKALGYVPYGSAVSLEATGADSYVIFGAEVMTGAEAGLTEEEIAKYPEGQEFAIRSFRTIASL
ncbi:MAG: hypothetical protein J6D04_00990 [Clostridia bacterium]|nr:hypothetical protein [Clostridia bacterium]